MQKSFIVALVVVFVVGGFGGYLIGGSKAHPVNQTALNAEMPVAMHEGDQDKTLEELKSLSGSAKDQAYLKDMIAHHQAAVDMSKALLESTKRPELKDLANNVIATQSQEIESMKLWLREWYGI
ncbi:hypothetical protein BH11PAT2_BH11PAT2_04680 [soil metagenome]